MKPSIPNSNTSVSRQGEDPEDEMLTPRELGARLAMSPSALRRLARRGVLPAYKIGGAWLFRLEEILNHARQSARRTSRETDGPPGSSVGRALRRPQADAPDFASIRSDLFE